MYVELTTGSTPNTAGNWALLTLKFGPNVTVAPEIVAVNPHLSMSASAGSCRRSYQVAARPDPSGFTAIAGINWALVVASLLSRTAAPQVAPPSVDCLKKILPRSPPLAAVGSL